MWRRFVLCIVVLLATSACSSTPEGEAKRTNPLDASVEELTAQITAGMTAVGKQRLAIFDFTTVEGEKMLLGALLREELIARFFTTRHFTVVERRKIEEALTEQGFQASNVVDDTTAIRLGKVLGVDVIVIGTIADFGETYRVHGRLLAVETGEVFAIARTDLTKDEALRHFLGDDGNRHSTGYKYKW